MLAMFPSDADIGTMVYEVMFAAAGPFIAMCGLTTADIDLRTSCLLGLFMGHNRLIMNTEVGDSVVPGGGGLVNRVVRIAQQRIRETRFQQIHGQKRRLLHNQIKEYIDRFSVLHGLFLIL